VIKGATSCANTLAHQLGGNFGLKRPIGIIILVYLIIGVVVAWSRGYLHLSLLKAILSAGLAILLWWLPLLGISLHIY
jgi:hypothetical protein